MEIDTIHVVVTVIDDIDRWQASHHNIRIRPPFLSPKVMLIQAGILCHNIYFSYFRIYWWCIFRFRLNYLSISFILKTKYDLFTVKVEFVVILITTDFPEWYINESIKQLTEILLSDARNANFIYFPVLSWNVSKSLFVSFYSSFYRGNIYWDFLPLFCVLSSFSRIIIHVYFICSFLTFCVFHFYWPTY